MTISKLSMHEPNSDNNLKSVFLISYYPVLDNFNTGAQLKSVDKCILEVYIQYTNILMSSCFNLVFVFP